MSSSDKNPNSHNPAEELSADASKLTKNAKSYLKRAAKLGQDVEALKAGHTLEGTATIHSIEDFKELMSDGLTDDHRQCFSGLSSGEAPADDAMIDALADYVYGTKDLSPEAKSHAEKLFPVTVAVTSGESVTIESDQEYGPSGPPKLINAGTLTFDGGSITAVTTSLTISADKLKIVKSGTKSYTVGVLGKQGADGDDCPPSPAYDKPAPRGKDASAPSPGICTGADNGGTGDPGKQGQGGDKGKDGEDGHTNLPASITIRSMDATSPSPFVIYTRSGGGGDGGKGGKGGPGQDGGKGGKGCDSGCEGTDGGDGGKGGNGGNGGNGGPGGNGVSGTQISVTFPRAQQSLLQTITDTAKPGEGGERGASGKAGVGGKGGEGGKHKTNGQHGQSGDHGDHGTPGTSGTKTGAAGNINVSYI
ncbi:hypothetical protein [Halomonas llamarensis]|uniref:Collagen-like protein n=1 Tax=Halomonas llamarensis TaxID=2945104 RepID=A0ABT0SL48_9GAMM|nr:hypothetical protein [Halomonas llamarensis]MCL7928525.1 hypothetical protein [Halomonas llamarensis]